MMAFQYIKGVYNKDKDFLPRPVGAMAGGDDLNWKRVDLD